MRTLIQNGTILDPATGTTGVRDIFVEDAFICAVRDPKAEEQKSSNEKFDRVIDASGLYVMPGFIDMHVHLREPGFEYKETVETGSRAAAAGGFTTILAMPNTKPVPDSVEQLQEFMKIVQASAVVNVLPIGSVTVGQNGACLSDIEGMAKHGICAVSEDGKSVMDISLYREGMLACKRASIPMLAHCEDRDLLHGGVLNAGAKADELGMPGITNTVEDHIAIRDILLANELKTKLHLCHCSTALSVEFLRMAKRLNMPVTAEVCPHHFSLTEDDIPGDDANYKMNPPLRTRTDAEALISGLKDGTIDVIATDHAPHSEEEKRQSIRTAPFGIVGLETAFALGVTKLVKPGHLTLMDLAEKMSYRPAQILGLDRKDGRGTLAVGAVADLVIVAPEEAYIVDREKFLSKGKNTPFHGSKVCGKVKKTLVSGRVVYENGGEYDSKID